MIYLITGNMGTGKTSRAVSMILNNEDGLFKQTLDDGSVVDRPLFFCHIDGLDAAKFNAHELTKDEIQAAPLDAIMPTGGILIVDEAHWVYPVRAAAKAVPEYIQKLSELRHDGFTLILLTQHPSQLDIFVRNLVSKHIHLERKSLGMKQYWWYKCVTNLDNPAGISGTESSSWKPPKDAFKYYKSSSQHQKFVKKIPVAVWLLIVILGFIGWKATNLYRVYDKSVNHTKEQVAQTTDSGINDLTSSAPIPALNGNQEREVNNHLTAAMFVPTLAERPESKPLYDNIRQVKQYERIAACIKGGNSGCTCYSDQATKLKEISQEVCLDYVENGLPFDPFREPTQQTAMPSQSIGQPENVSNNQILELDGKPLPSLTAGRSERLAVIQ